MKSLDEMLKAMTEEADSLVEEADLDDNCLDATEDDKEFEDDENEDLNVEVTNAQVMNDEYEPDEDEIVLSIACTPGVIVPVEAATKTPRKQSPSANKRFSGIVASREATIKQKFAVFTRAMSENYKVQWEKVKLATMTHGEINAVLSREVTAESLLKEKGVVPNV